MRTSLLAALLLLTACSHGDARDSGGEPEGRVVTSTTAGVRPATWEARWEAELAAYYLASYKLIDAVEKREPFEIISRRVDAMATAGQALLGAVDRAGPPPPEQRAAAGSIRSALENEPTILDQFRGACTLDGDARNPQGCSGALEALVANGLPLVRAVEEIQS